MNTISILKKFNNSQIENEDYFAVKIVFDSSIEMTKYIGFYFNDTDLLELSVNKDTNIIKKIQLVVCNHFEIISDYLTECKDFEEGTVSINLPQHNDCEMFNVQVFKNAVKIMVSNMPVCKNVKCGQVLFGLSSENDLVEVSVNEMNNQDIAHTIDELKSGKENK